MSDKPGSGFVSLKALKGDAPRSPGDILGELRRIYFKTSKQTIQHDFAHAIELLKQLPDDESRDKAAVYMEGIAQMRKEWDRESTKARGRRPKASGQPNSRQSRGKRSAKPPRPKD